MNITETQISEAIEKIGGWEIGGDDAARALRDIGLNHSQIVEALSSEAGLGLNQFRVAQALYFTEGLDLDAQDVARAMADNTRSVELNAEIVSRVLYFSDGLDLDLVETAEAMLQVPEFSRELVAKALYEMGFKDLPEGAVYNISADEIAAAIAAAAA
jgi:hypothetical protein